LAGSVWVLTQKAPQAVPVVHVSVTHAPAEQIWPPTHAVPQAPQWSGSICRFVQTDRAPVPQIVLGDRHVDAHAPFVQTSLAPHFVPHAPQFCGSVWKFVQEAETPLPQAFGVAAGQAQVLPAQAWPAGQALPQAPQFAASVASVAQ
jgi:hypothetical protein